MKNLAQGRMVTPVVRCIDIIGNGVTMYVHMYMSLSINFCVFTRMIDIIVNA